MARGFEIIREYENINIPIRKTKYSAGYDIEAAIDVVIPPFEPNIKPTLIPTGLKAYFENDEWLMLVNRSSGPKKGLVMANGIGVIDSDYYNNETNEGHIYFQYYNVTNKEILIKKGDVIGQAIFQKFLITDNDKADGVRLSGFGSTDKK